MLQLEIEDFDGHSLEIFFRILLNIQTEQPNR